MMGNDISQELQEKLKIIEIETKIFSQVPLRPGRYYYFSLILWFAMVVAALVLIKSFEPYFSLFIFALALNEWNMHSQQNKIFNMYSDACEIINYYRNKEEIAP